MSTHSSDSAWHLRYHRRPVEIMATESNILNLCKLQRPESYLLHFLIRQNWMCSSLTLGTYFIYTMAYPFPLESQHKPKIIFTYSILCMKVYD